MNAIFSAPHFQNDDAARAFLESILWPDGPVCPHCGVVNHAFKTNRPGVFRCGEKACRKDFTVTMKTVMERSHIALHKWLQGFHLMTSSKKGYSAHQLHRTLGITYRSAWFMWHRVREAMRAGGLAPMGGEGETVEIDESYIGRKPGIEARPGWVHHKHAVLTLVERGGSARSFHIDEATKENIVPIVRENIARESHLMTDEARRYERLGDEFAAHSAVDHSRGEYGYTDRKTGASINTNTVEGYYSIFKRGMKGVYQHCGEQHLHRYLAEFDFRYSNRVALGVDDRERARRAVSGASGKRLTYQGAH
jgi:transposase-like protein